MCTPVAIYVVLELQFNKLKCTCRCPGRSLSDGEGKWRGLLVMNKIYWSVQSLVISETVLTRWYGILDYLVHVRVKSPTARPISHGASTPKVLG
jgi:hypothetical protein